MILKKPYGLLIKHFKLIHLILTILAGYLIFQTGHVVGFFRDYVANDYSVTVVENMASQYVTWVIYALILVALVMLVALYVLLQYKKKPTKFYLAAIVYYTFLLLMMFVAAGLIGSLNQRFWETASARQYRDFANIIYFPQYLFICLFGMRALGFDVKRFDFKNDIKELELSEQDSELIEINIGFDVSKVERGIRRAIREFTYYFKENKFIFYLGIGILVVFLLYSGFSGYEKVKFTYSQGNTFTYDQFKIKVEDSILTNVNYNGETIDADKYYLLVRFSVVNNTSNSRVFDYTNFKVYFGREYYNPTLDIGSNFIDYAKPYYGEKLSADNEHIFLMTYAIDKKYVNRNFAITIHNGFSLKKEEYIAKTISVKLNPVKIEGNQIVRSAKLNEEVSFAGTYLGDTRLTIKDYVIGQKYIYKYQSCYKDDCKEYNDIVSADANIKNTQTLVVLGYDFSMDTSSLYYRSYKTVSNFANHFAKIQYVIDGKTKVVDTVVKTPTNMSDKIVLQTISEVEKAEKVNLLIKIRDKSYAIQLKTS
ncbi:MAG: hypothetical protein K2M17_00840 [Bacilli bacterium]|nr:hypothetical protein [Bacilli bacterium]